MTGGSQAGAEKTVVARGTTYRLAQIHGPDMAPLVPLFRKVYRRTDFTLDWLKRKYGCSYYPGGGFACVAFTGSGEAVASCGVLPWPIRFGSNGEVAGQLIDAATDREHRHRGLFTELGNMVHSLCDKAGITFMFGFAHPQGNSYPGLTRNLGYAHIGDLVEYRLPIRTVWAERVALHSTRMRRVYDAYARRALGAYVPRDPVLSNSLVAEGFAATDRDADFHAYKSFAGGRVVAVQGGRVWLKVRRGLLIGDLEARSASDMEKTAHALPPLAARLGVHQILFQSSRDTRFSRFFETRWQPLPCLAVIHRNFRSTIPPEKLRFTFGDQDNY